MDLSIHSRALIRGILAGAVVLAGATACSRDRRTDSATVGDTSAVISADTTIAQTTNEPSTPAPDQSASVAAADTSAGVETAAPRPEAGTAKKGTRDTSTAAYQAMERDTSAAPGDTIRPTSDTTLPGDQSSAAPSDSAPMEVATPLATPSADDSAIGDTTSSETAVTDTSTTADVAAGQDTISTEVAATDTSITTDVAAGQDTVSAEMTTPDTSGHQAAIADSSYPEMARDTSAAPEAADSGVIQAQVDATQADSAVAVNGGVSGDAGIAAAGEADTAGVVGDSAVGVVSAQVDTTAEVTTEVAVQDTPDTITVVGDSSSVDKPGPRAKEDTISARADSLAENYDSERIRPPQDSTELAGNVTSDQYADSANVHEEGQETVAQAEAPTDDLGAAGIKGEVTGGVALDGTTFQGGQCVVADAASDDTISLDMSNTPASLNPCGLGSMVPSRFWTRKE